MFLIYITSQRFSDFHTKTYTEISEILKQHSVPKQTGSLVVILAPTWANLPHLPPLKPNCLKVRGFQFIKMVWFFGPSPSIGPKKTYHIQELWALTFKQFGFRGCKCGRLVQVGARITTKLPDCLGTECCFNNSQSSVCYSIRHP